MPSEQPVFVLIHSPLVGPLTWTLVAEELRRRGHDVVVPRLDNPERPTGGLFRHHAERVRQAVEAHSRTAPVILVGHSGAGAVLPAAGDTLVNAVVGYVFVDAGLPRDRATRLDDAPPDFAKRIHDLAADGLIPPWAQWWSDDVLAALIPDSDQRERFAEELEPLPVALFDEPISVPPAWPDAPCGYFLLSAAYDDAAAQASAAGWQVEAIDGTHLHMLVDPVVVADGVEALGTGFEAAGPSDAPPAKVGGTVGAPGTQTDPIAAQRARIGGWVETGRRVGFLALAVAVILFGVALYWDLPGLVVQLIILSLIVASLSLLPSLIVGYGLAAAEREDREREHDR